MRKGQTEVIGLLVIVILFIIIFFIFLAFSSKDEGERELRQSLESSNSLRAMMFYTPKDTDGNLCGKQIREIIEECRENKIICGVNCKEFLDEEINNSLEASMDKTYSFSLDSEHYRFARTEGNCNLGVADSYKTRGLEALMRIC